MNTAAPALGARVGGETQWQSKIYKAVVTPIYFVTFLLSLYFIDNRYRAQRSYQHESNERPWLHRFLFRQLSSPYDDVQNQQGRSLPPPQSANITHRYRAGTTGADDDPQSTTKEAWFYHTKQMKLLKLEAADAFALRDSVLFALCMLAVLVGWALWRMVVWLTA
ncbi:hypothetical protein F4859DRAFT_362462 [Xylaria cf. heliscus]|nr:hypothetical protein F4859DRAFT_362462 [Xylaria cf. heliscus]